MLDLVLTCGNGMGSIARVDSKCVLSYRKAETIFRVGAEMIFRVGTA
jgi:hypothetical protein